MIIADGPPIPEQRTPPEQRREPTPRPSPSSPKPDGTALIAALDWIEARSKQTDSRYFNKIDMTKVAVMGMSCGGLMACGASGDKRVTTVGIWNSGLLEPNAAIFAALRRLARDQRNVRRGSLYAVHEAGVEGPTAWPEINNRPIDHRRSELFLDSVQFGPGVDAPRRAANIGKFALSGRKPRAYRGRCH